MIESLLLIYNKIQDTFLNNEYFREEVPKNVNFGNEVFFVSSLYFVIHF